MAGEEVKVTPDLTAGIRALTILAPLFVIALTVYIVRIWTRCLPKCRLNASDYTISVAMVSTYPPTDNFENNVSDHRPDQLAETIVIVLTAVTVSRGYGRPRSLIPKDDLETIGPIMFAVFFIALFASAFARISICCLLLNITQERTWKIVLWVNIVFQGLALAALDILQLVQCRPIHANWTFVADARCLPPDHVWTIVCLFGGQYSIDMAVIRHESRDRSG